MNKKLQTPEWQIFPHEGYVVHLQDPKFIANQDGSGTWWIVAGHRNMDPDTWKKWADRAGKEWETSRQTAKQC